MTMYAGEEDGHAREHGFDEEFTQGEAGEDHLTLEDLHRLKLNITADLGRSSMLVREILELKEGSIIPLNKLAGEMADIYVNGVPLAKGEVVVLVDSLHVRVAEINDDQDEGGDHG